MQHMLQRAQKMFMLVNQFDESIFSLLLFESEKSFHNISFRSIHKKGHFACFFAFAFSLSYLHTHANAHLCQLFSIVFYWNDDI